MGLSLIWSEKLLDISDNFRNYQRKKNRLFPRAVVGLIVHNENLDQMLYELTKTTKTTLFPRSWKYSPICRIDSKEFEY